MLIDILDNIPKFLMFFIPGYIFLLKRRSIYFYKKDDDIDLIVKSVGISAIIKLISGVLLSFKRINALKTNDFIKAYRDELIIVFYIFVAYMLFYLITYIEYKFNTCYKLKVIDYFKERGENEDKKGKENFLNLLLDKFLYRENQPTVWNYVLDNSYNKQIRVYMKDTNVVYMGFLKYYTLDPTAEIKEICLNQFTIVEELVDWEEEGDLFKEKDCFFEDKNSCVYITSENIRRIEIIDVT